MDRGSFLAWCLLGIAVALAVFFTLGAKRRALVPRSVWWPCLTQGAVPCMFGLSHSTPPSFATRITATGKAYDYVEWKTGLRHLLWLSFRDRQRRTRQYRDPNHPSRLGQSREF